MSVLNNMDPIEIRKQIELAAESRCALLKAREKRLAEGEREIREWFRLKNILSVHTQEDIITRDLIIKISVREIVEKGDQAIGEVEAALGAKDE